MKSQIWNNMKQYFSLKLCNINLIKGPKSASPENGKQLQNYEREKQKREVSEKE